MQDGTLVFLLRGNPPTEILLGFKKNGFGQGKFNGFGGKIEANESIESAAARELKEECGVQVAVSDLQHGAHLDFVFPAKPEWDQIVHAFVAHQWRGEPIETRETPALPSVLPQGKCACGASVKPIWLKTNAIPYDKMWADDVQWLSLALKGQRVEATFVFKDDNQTVDAAKIKLLLDADQRR